MIISIIILRGDTLIADKDLIDRMRQFRADRGMNKSTFASLCGLSPQTIDRIETGKPLRISSLVLIERTLGLSEEECNRLIIECTARQRKLYRITHAEYYKRNREAILEYQRQYYRDTADKRAKDRAENPELFRYKEAQRREQRREQLRTYNREYQRKRRQRLKANVHGAEIEAPENNAPAEPDPTKAGD